MSFHERAEDIRLDDGHILVARLADGEGEFHEVSIDLNEFLGNSEGSFEWGGENFSLSAEDISFELEGDDNVPILRAKLANSEGEHHDADVNLAERIGNENGSFAFV
ncbi:Cyanovirin-N [Aspergillus floccosus]